MVTVVTYLWGTKYKPAHVQRLAQSVSHWLTVPHRFVCISDRTVPDVFTMRNPAPQFPSRCYRRLWLFSQAASALGETILNLDIDLVICGPLDPLVTRDVDFAIYKAPSLAGQRGWAFGPAVFWLKTGTQTDIWTNYIKAPIRLAAQANRDGFWGSDQAVISHLRKDAAMSTFTDEDGVVSFRRIRSEGLSAPPPGTRIVSFHGRRTPFEREIQAEHPWILDAWREAA